MTVPAADKLRGPWSADRSIDAARTAADLLDAIDALHQPEETVNGWHCKHDGFAWPCADHRLLHPEPQPCQACGGRRTMLTHIITIEGDEGVWKPCPYCTPKENNDD